jgi:hypothetical protein
MTGNCVVSRVHGDIRLKGPLPEGEHFLDAEGDIVLRWPDSSPINLLVRAPRVSNQLPLDSIEEDEGVFSGKLGDGKTNVVLASRGRVVLKSLELIKAKWGEGLNSMNGFDLEFLAEMEGLGGRIAAEFSQQADRLAREIDRRFGPDFAERIAEKVSREADKAARHAERAAERAQRMAEKETVRAERYRQRSARHAPPGPAAPTFVETKPPIAAEEQLKILRMVEKGIISPEEANELLKALEA